MGVRKGQQHDLPRPQQPLPGSPRLCWKKEELTRRASCDMGLKVSGVGSTISDSTNAGFSL